MVLGLGIGDGVLIIDFAAGVCESVEVEVVVSSVFVG
jgi:hypothetical protein